MKIFVIYVVMNLWIIMIWSHTQDTYITIQLWSATSVVKNSLAKKIDFIISEKNI